MNRNYQKELDRLLASFAPGEKPRLLLHSCCGPCSSAVLEYLCPRFRVSLLWYNPNLYPETEFERRLETQKELLEKMGLRDEVELLVEPWRAGDFQEIARGLENEPEGGARCTECFRLRLRETAKLAAARSFDYFCTTLTLSRHKDAARINALGERIAAETGARWLPSDFKKQGREMRSAELAEQLGLYRQLYCGCEFSLHLREEKSEEKEGETQ